MSGITRQDAGPKKRRVILDEIKKHRKLRLQASECLGCWDLGWDLGQGLTYSTATSKLKRQATQALRPLAWELNQILGLFLTQHPPQYRALLEPNLLMELPEPGLATNQDYNHTCHHNEIQDDLRGFRAVKVPGLSRSLGKQSTGEYDFAYSFRFAHTAAPGFPA